MHNQTILVTGGAGFIGANLVDELVRNEWGSVHILVAPNTNLWRLQNLLDSIIVHEIDLADFDAVNTLVTAITPQLIFHLASYGGMPQQSDQKTVCRVNFDGTVNLLNACKEVGFSCFINTGSSSEYGMKQTAMREDMMLEPISDYAVAKAAATNYCLKEALFNKLPIYTIRPFAVYGDYEMPTRLVPTIVVNTLRNTPINLSSPHCVRDFIYVKDMVSLFCAVALQKPHGCYIFNGGTGIQSTIGDVIATVQASWSQTLVVNWGQSTPRPWEPTVWQADITQATTVLGWKPCYSLHDGLRASLSWFENNLTWYPEQGAFHEPKPHHTTPTTTCNR